MKTNTQSLILSLLLVHFGALFGAQAVSPAPDGCYSSVTTAEGCNTLQNLATGLGNTGVGWYALFATSIGSYNTAVGAGALASNAGNQNTSTGVGSLLSNTSGFGNTADGAFALFNNTAGGVNIAIGYQAESALTTGNNNIDIGSGGVAGESNTIRIGDPTIHAGIFLAGITPTSAAAPNQAMVVNPKASADKLKKCRWSLAYVSAVDTKGRDIFIFDAHRGDGKRFVVRADENWGKSST